MVITFRFQVQASQIPVHVSLGLTMQKKRSSVLFCWRMVRWFHVPIADDVFPAAWCCEYLVRTQYTASHKQEWDESDDLFFMFLRFDSLIDRRLRNGQFANVSRSALEGHWVHLGRTFTEVGVVFFSEGGLVFLRLVTLHRLASLNLYETTTLVLERVTINRMLWDALWRERC